MPFERLEPGAGLEHLMFMIVATSWKALLVPVVPLVVEVASPGLA
jgi:hypothetical protein